VKRRWAWNIFCALSLLIFATSVTLWVRSYFATEVFGWFQIERDGSGAEYSLLYQRDIVGFRIFRSDVLRQSPTFRGWRHLRFPPTSIYPPGNQQIDYVNLQFARFVFHFRRNRIYPSWFTDLVVHIPLWLFLIFAVPPLLWWGKRRKRLGGRGFPVAAATDQQATEKG
jgi:hypothetical protein